MRHGSFGHGWYAARRSAVLLVPSAVARVERNIVINAEHPEFPRIRTRIRDADLVGRAAVQPRGTGLRGSPDPAAAEGGDRPRRSARAHIP